MSDEKDAVKIWAIFFIKGYGHTGFLDCVRAETAEAAFDLRWWLINPSGKASMAGTASEEKPRTFPGTNARRDVPVGQHPSRINTLTGFFRDHLRSRQSRVGVRDEGWNAGRIEAEIVQSIA